MTVALTACSAPISNRVFLDEAAFLSALPSTERLQAPQGVLLAPNGDATVLEAAKTEASRWETWWAIATATGEELRSRPADERTEVRRRWEPLNVAARLTGDAYGAAGEVVDWWALAEVVLVPGEAPTWTIELSDGADGPWVEVGTGETEEDAGSLTWDLAGTAGVLGSTPPDPLGTLTATFQDADADLGGIRSVEAAHDLDGFVVPYGIAGDEIMAFTGSLAITADGAAWPAFVTAIHTGAGGRAQGVVFELGVERAFTSCWDAEGHLVWQSGEGSVLGAGTSEQSCAIPAF